MIFYGKKVGKNIFWAENVIPKNYFQRLLSQ